MMVVATPNQQNNCITLNNNPIQYHHLPICSDGDAPLSPLHALDLSLKSSCSKLVAFLSILKLVAFLLLNTINEDIDQW